MEKDNQKLNTYIIPQNHTGFLGSAKFIRKIIEGVLSSFIIFQLLSMIPFTFKVKFILILIICALSFTLCLVGIGDESIGQFLIGYIRFLCKRKKYTFRTPKQYKLIVDEKKEKEAGNQDREEYKSGYEKLKEKLIGSN